MPDFCRATRYKGDILKDFQAVMQQNPIAALPAPDADSVEHSRACAAWIRDRIRDAGGSISFAEFMHYVLYTPGHGYYAGGASKFGAAGDFVTAPEISSLFGAIVAGQCAEALAVTGGGDIVEFGAGSGKLAADILATLDERDVLPDRYRILEVSPDLAERQARLLGERVPHLVERIDWLDRLPGETTGVVIANEVLDALPVERFRRTADGVEQLRVVLAGDAFAFAAEPAPDMIRDAVDAIESDLGGRLPAGYVSEMCLAAPRWIGDLAGALRNGIALLFDYGTSRREYYAPDRGDGWLRCHFRHHAHSDPLILPGIQDLTAWIDFTAVAGAAVDCGLEVAGYLSQSQFLINAGLDRALAGIGELPQASQLAVSSQVRMLTLPGEMGENVKCLGLSAGVDKRPSAFRHGDRTHTL